MVVWPHLLCCLQIVVEEFSLQTCRYVFLLRSILSAQHASSRLCVTKALFSLFTLQFPVDCVDAYWFSVVGQYLWGIEIGGSEVFGSSSSTMLNYLLDSYYLAGLHMQSLHMSNLQQVTGRHGCKLSSTSWFCFFATYLGALSLSSSVNKCQDLKFEVMYMWWFQS